MLKTKFVLISLLIVVFFLGCENKGNTKNETEYIHKNEGISMIEEGVILSLKLRQSSEWKEINDYAQLFLDSTGKEIAQIDSVIYYLTTDDIEYIRSPGMNCYFEFETMDKIWESKCTSIYVEPNRLLFGIYGLYDENSNYSVDQIMEYWGKDVTWGTNSGYDYFQYTFNDILVRLYVDMKKEELLPDGYALIEKTTNKNGKLFTGIKETYIIPDSILEKSDWYVINKYKNELGKTMEEIDDVENFKEDYEQYNYATIRTGINYSFGIDGKCDIIVFPAQEFFPEANNNISIKELRELLNVDLVWGSYDGGVYHFIFNNFMFYLDTDENRNVLLESNIIMKSR